MAPPPRRTAHGDDSIIEPVHQSEDEIIVLSGSDEPAGPTTVTRRKQPDTPVPPTPLGDRTNGLTPELGRHASWDSSRAKSLSVNDENTASTPTVRNNDSTKLSRAFATPSPGESSEAAQRRKDHVLMSLKSTSKPRFIKGTPHPLRVQQSADSDNSSETSSQDLTTYHRSANTSMPSAGGVDAKGARFNGAKLNAYLHTLNSHLTEENQSLIQALGTTNKELERVKRGAKRLEDQVREMSQSGVTVDSSVNATVDEAEEEESDLQQRLESIVKSHENIDLLKAKISAEAEQGEDRIAKLEALLRERDLEIERLREQKMSDDTERSIVEDRRNEHERLLARHEELVESLEEKDRQLLDQETVFAEKMASLETELATVMESQEEALQKARHELEEAQHRQEEADAEREAQLNELEDELETCARELADKDDEIHQLKTELDEITGRKDRIEQEFAALQDQVALRRSTATATGSPDSRLANLEAELEALQQQLASATNELETTKAQLAEERKALKAQVGNVAQHATKARSPLINEIKDDSREAIEGELEQARDEIRVLKHRLDGPAARAEREVQQIKLRTLEAQKSELEARVNELRKLADIGAGATPMRKTPASPAERSFLFRSIAGLKTPKTPGQFASSWTPGTAADTTISPLLGQIDDQQEMIMGLREQLSEANKQIDQKVDKLSMAGSDVISIASKLAESEEKAALLEVELDRLVGADGDLERLKKKLEHMRCPGCTKTFDANAIVKLAVDPKTRGISYAGSSSIRSSGNADAVRTALASVNRKCAELQAENAVLQEAAARSASQPTFAQQSALKLDLDRAAGEIATLERELDFERAKLKELASRAPVERQQSGDAKRTASEVKALKAEQEKLRAERADLLRGVAGLQADLKRVRQDAVTLGLDLANARRERTETYTLDLANVRDELDGARRRVEALEKEAVSASTAAYGNGVQATEVKGLLVMIRYLKLRVTRESILRTDLALQKALLVQEVYSSRTRSEGALGLCEMHRYRPRARPTLKGVATAVLALKRMEKLSAGWRAATALKERLRNDAYRHTRGKPFPASS